MLEGKLEPARVRPLAVQLGTLHAPAADTEAIGILAERIRGVCLARDRNDGRHVGEAEAAGVEEEAEPVVGRSLKVDDVRLVDELTSIVDLLPREGEAGDALKAADTSGSLGGHHARSDARVARLLSNARVKLQGTLPIQVRILASRNTRRLGTT